MNISTIKKLITKGCFIAAVLLFTSCATIFGGKKNTLKINQGYPESASVYIDGKYIGDAPLKQRISKFELQEGSLIEIKKEGFVTYKHEVIRSPHVIYVMADIVAGVIPLVVDVADANIYRPNTRNIKYKLLPMDSIGKTMKSEPKKSTK